MSIYNKDISNSEKICSFLLLAGANPNLRNSEGLAPIHIAIRKRQI